MPRQEDFFTCSQCGYHFPFNKNMRCPRCYKLIIKAGSCSGSCSKCSESKACGN